MVHSKPDEPLSEAETERRFKTTLHKMLTSPHQPHETAAGKKHKRKEAKSRPSKTVRRSGKDSTGR